MWAATCLTLKAVAAYRKQREIRYPRAFLVKIVRDTVHDYWRRKRVIFDISTIDESRFVDLPNFEVDMDRRRQAALLREALLRMESSKRATLELYYENDYSISEISLIQGKSESAVKTELMRTRRALAEQLQELARKRWTAGSVGNFKPSD